MSVLKSEVVGKPHGLATAADVAADPTVLWCRACKSELSLSDDPAVRRAEMVAFCDAHNGHGKRMGFAVRMPVPADGAQRAHLPRLSEFILSTAVLCGVEIAAALALRRPEWPFR